MSKVTDAAKVVTKPLAKLVGPSQCKAARDLIILSVKGPVGAGGLGWQSVEDFKSAVADNRRFKKIDPDTMALIMEMVLAIMEAMMENKSKNATA